MSKPNTRQLAFLSTVCAAALLFPLVGMADSTPNTSNQAPTATTAPAKPAMDPDAERKANREAFFASRLAALHAGLQLKQDQESLWPPVEDALRGLARTHGHHHHWRHEEGANHAPDLQKLGEHLVARGQAISKLADAATPLVASLTPQQKDRLPILLRGMRPARLLDRAFAVEADRDEDFGDRWGHDGHHDFDRDHDEDRGFDHHERHGEMDGDHEWRGGHGEHADRDGFGERDGGADYDWRPRHHHHDDDGSDAT